MKLQIIAIAIVILSNFQIKARADESETVPCGRRLVNHEALIVNGYKSKEGDWPWHSSILHIAINLNIEYKCGGTLINSNSVLTAAHCVYENDRPIVADRVIIQLGRHNLKISGAHTQEIEAYQTIPHPNFNTSSLSNDIAVIRLATEVTFNDYVQPICLWDANKKDLSEVVGKYGTVVGFGITEKNKISYTLRQADIPVVSITTCLDSDRSFYGNFLSDYTFCAGYQNGTSACNGDSGGSLTFEVDGVYRIRGIVSLTQARPGVHSQLCKTDQYAVFTDVAKYLHWIEDIVPVLPSPVAEERNWESKKLTCKFGWNDYEKRYECVNSSFSSTTDNVRISSVDGTFSDGRTYSDVNTVIINGGRTTYIPEMSKLKKIFPNFVRLFITNSGVEHVERSKLTRLSQLRILNFYGNEIETLNQDVLYDLPNLEIFAFVTNRIRILPENLISKQLKLKELWAWDNQIESIPRNFFKNNKELTHLWLSNNLFKRIDADFKQLRNLKVLDLRGNKCIDAQACEGCGINFDEINDIVDRNCK